MHAEIAFARRQRHSTKFLGKIFHGAPSGAPAATDKNVVQASSASEHGTFGRDNCDSSRFVRESDSSFQQPGSLDCRARLRLGDITNGSFRVLPLRCTIKTKRIQYRLLRRSIFENARVRVGKFPLTLFPPHFCRPIHSAQ